MFTALMVALMAVNPQIAKRSIELILNNLYLGI